MKTDNQAMDDVSKFRLTGAVIWLGLLVLIVPTWYSNPVNFTPDNEQGAAAQSNKLVVYQAYTLPSKSAQPVSPESQQHAEIAKGLAVTKVERVVERPAAPEKIETAKPTSGSPTTGQVARPKVKMTSIGIPEVKSGQWLLKIYSSKDIKDANNVLAKLDDQYEVWIKAFPKSKTYSVRTGPYTSRDLAEVDKIKIDKAIRTQSKIEQVK